MVGTILADQTQQQVLSLLFEQDDLSWKDILLNLVKTEQMDPWDVNITQLTKKYIQAIKQMQEHDMRISGKMLLAAALLLRIKSTQLVEKDLAEFDLLLAGEEYNEDELFNGSNEMGNGRDKSKYQLIPRNPQPRTRKMSIHDLIQALQKAMETKKRILAQQRPVKYVLPKRNIDIIEVIYDLYHKIMYYSGKNNGNKLTFTQLLPPRAGKQDKAYTFIPLLHLETLRKIETEQKHPFEEIYITAAAKKTPK
ncbi:segregation/condensation protein A [Candidatus Woesearchaeota archaeon]|nr:segregation/condensation protein A [Candidatus Woesearchaeota archaeon]